MHGRFLFLFYCSFCRYRFFKSTILTGICQVWRGISSFFVYLCTLYY
ncbi:hypothetical protein HMPREF9441_03044 [Paraprevotella clara YIT 11840]|uniref:Uncharacterized protein n=1 Tax=Paraprevotella clara YIT 11840 TaxID=762968 RepID=G5SUI3_9BACT|nr:hypothetical protein HMPREF9441_03044 [Paraprevotella clara YIT 11840]